jgi:hypothetical protein
MRPPHATIPPTVATALILMAFRPLLPSIAFLPLSDELPGSLNDEISRLLSGHDGVRVSPPVGSYTVHYEQQETPANSTPAFHRNVVARRQMNAIYKLLGTSWTVTYGRLSSLGK